MTHLQSLHLIIDESVPTCPQRILLPTVTHLTVTIPQSVHSFDDMTLDWRGISESCRAVEFEMHEPCFDILAKVLRKLQWCDNLTISCQWDGIVAPTNQNFVIRQPHVVSFCGNPLVSEAAVQFCVTHFSWNAKHVFVQ